MGIFLDNDKIVDTRQLKRIEEEKNGTNNNI